MNARERLFSPRNSRLWFTTLVGLAIAYSPSYIAPILRSLGLRWESQGPPSVILWNWLAVGVLVTFIFFVEKRDLTSLRLTKPNRQDLEWAIFFWGLARRSLVPCLFYRTVAGRVP
jgi:beta-lactamase regulating signal transducer with metallopeptidase domain